MDITLPANHQLRMTQQRNRHIFIYDGICVDFSVVSFSADDLQSVAYHWLIFYVSLSRGSQRYIAACCMYAVFSAGLS